MRSIPRSALKVMCLTLVIPCITAACAGWGTFGFLIGAIDGRSETQLVVLYAAAGGD